MRTAKTLSITLIVLGFLLLLVGFMSGIQHWPDTFKGLYYGPIIMAIGAFIFIMRLVKK